MGVLVVQTNDLGSAPPLLRNLPRRCALRLRPRAVLVRGRRARVPSPASAPQSCTSSSPRVDGARTDLARPRAAPCTEPRATRLVAAGSYSIGNGGIGGNSAQRGRSRPPRATTLIPLPEHRLHLLGARAGARPRRGRGAAARLHALRRCSGFKIALLADDGFSKLLAVGLTFAFALQTFIIVGGDPPADPADRDHAAVRHATAARAWSPTSCCWLGLLLVSNRANAGHRVNRQISTHRRGVASCCWRR